MESMTTVKCILYLQGTRISVYKEDGEIVSYYGSNECDINEVSSDEWWEWLRDNTSFSKSSPLDLCILAGAADGGDAESFAGKGKEYIQQIAGDDETEAKKYLVSKTSWSTNGIKAVLRKIVDNPNEEIKYIEEVKQFILPYHKEKNVTAYGMIDDFRIIVDKEKKPVRGIRIGQKAPTLSVPRPSKPAASHESIAHTESRPEAKVKEPEVKKEKIAAVSVKTERVRPVKSSPSAVKPEIPREEPKPTPKAEVKPEKKEEPEIVFPKTKVNENLPDATGDQIAAFLEEELHS